jgi:hypothetical protein
MGVTDGGYKGFVYPTFSLLQQGKGGEGWGGEEKLRTPTFRSKVTPMYSRVYFIIHKVSEKCDVPLNYLCVNRAKNELPVSKQNEHQSSSGLQFSIIIFMNARPQRFKFLFR